MDALDRKLLTLVQKSFPVVPRPYAAIGEQLGIGEDEVLDRLGALKASGILRRLGAIINSRKLDFFSTLCAMKVPEDRVTEVAAVINRYPGVTHNYLREGEYNVWFTLICPSAREAQRIIEQIKEETGIQEMLNLPALRLFKVVVNFDLEREAARA
ncbi:MAG: Lrp/AsnC family transcriptional regulator [Clostridia bacterium]|nr:MAG: Lrp/AsnC family transcriptional regulator [Clostridia bacterium]